MLRTGTGKSGGRYRYYTCASHQIKGGTTCHRPVSVPEGELDRLVVAALADRLLTPGRLTTLLREAIKHRRIAASRTAARRSALQKKMDDLNGRQDEYLNLLKALDSELPEIRQALSKQQAVGIAATLKRRLLEAPRPLQKRYVHGLVSEIVVDRENSVISGPRAAIAAAVSAPDGHLGGVRSSVREWRSAQSGYHFAPHSGQTLEHIFFDCTPISLFNRENTGKFLDLEKIRHPTPLNHPAISNRWLRIPFA
jgi:hypothetical protein